MYTSVSCQVDIMETSKALCSGNLRTYKYLFHAYNSIQRYFQVILVHVVYTYVPTVTTYKQFSNKVTSALAAQS